MRKRELETVSKRVREGGDTVKQVREGQSERERERERERPQKGK